jgi:hypothetical protein
MKRPFDYHVSLRVKHPNLAAAAISTQLGLSPKTCWSAGEVRKSPKGAPLGGTRRESYCAFDVGSGGDGELTECLEAAVKSLKAQEGFLRDIRASGGTVMFYVYWYPNGDTGEVFGADLLREIAALEIELGINVYDDRTRD